MSVYTLPRKELATELSILQAALSKRITLPALAFARFGFQGGELEITATNLDITLKSVLKGITAQESAFCLPLKQLHQLVSLFEGDDVQLEPQSKGTRCRIQSSDAKHLLPMLEAKEFPGVDQSVEPSFSIDAKRLTAMLDSVRYSILPESSTVKASDQKFTGVQVSVAGGKLQIQASRKVTLAVSQCALDAPDIQPFIIPPQAVAALANFSEGEVAIGVTQGRASFTNGPRSLIARLYEGTFPDFLSLLPPEGQPITLNTNAVKEATRRVMLTTDTDNWERFEGIKYTFARESLGIESKGGDYGKSEELIPVTSQLNGDSIPFGINGRQILDFLNIAGESVVCELLNKDLIRWRFAEQRDYETWYAVCGVNLRW